MNNKDLLIISILTFITVVIWIFFDAFHTYTASTIPPDLKIQLEPLDANFSINEVSSIKDRPEFFSIVPPLSTVSANPPPSNLEQIPSAGSGQVPSATPSGTTSRP